jgi:very-short-patch-repair endonuclease
LWMVFAFIFIVMLCFILPRHNGTPESYIETRLYYKLIEAGYNPKAQVRCGPYRIDMVIGKIAIECDGKAFHSSPEQKKYDKRRDAYIRRHGYKAVLRFTGSEINKDVYTCINRIGRAVDKCL